MEKKAEIQTEDQKLWLKVEAAIASTFDVEDLRTSGILAGRSGRWNSALIRLSEAARFGLHDLQLLDTLGEAAFRAKAPEALLPFIDLYREPLIATHMARALTTLGEHSLAEEFLRYAQPSKLNDAIRDLLGMKNNISQAVDSMTNHPVEYFSEMQKIDFPPYWQALSAVADVAGRAELVTLAEERSKALDYANPVIHYNQSMRFLHRRQLRAAWNLYDWRLHPQSQASLPVKFFQVPMWQGETLKDKSLCILMEDGFGDQIFFLRYVAEAIKRSNVEIVAGPEIFELLKVSFPSVPLHRKEDLSNENYWHERKMPYYWCYCFSLPSRLAIFSPVHSTGYLRAADSEIINCVMQIQKINPQNLPVFGLTWHGDIRTAPMRTRAYSVEEFISQIPELQKPCVVLSLQKDATDEELQFLQTLLNDHGGVLLNAASTLSDFSKTAAWIKASDKVFSCDTAVAHLSGALAHPTTALIRNKSIWQWVPRSEKESDLVSFWYDSVEIQYALTPEFSYMFDLREEVKT